MTDRQGDAPVRVRIAPSPTGEPHVGTAYIALFNLALARKRGGQFILRIEDTDQERSRPEWERQIIDGLRWLGLTWDEGPDVGGPYAPYRQSERTEIYRTHSQQLVDAGHAYRCFCTKERLDTLRTAQRESGQANLGYDRHCRALADELIERHLRDGNPFVVRMKMPTEGTTEFEDGLRGKVSFENAGVDDQILLKSDGFPTYHLANVVDDHLMKISHVIRAEEWINSTPKHVLLYQMFGWTAPQFFHMPLLRNADRSKISKRKNPVSILDYRDRGFLPVAVLNYLAMLGWTMPDAREMFSFEEFVEHFSFDRMSLGGPVFDLEKLTWLNGKYYREALSEEALVQLIRDRLFSEERIRAIVPLLKERIDTLEQFVPAASYFFAGELTLSAADLLPKKRTYKELRTVMEAYAETIDRQVDFSAPALEAASRSFAEANDWPTRDLFMPIRVILTGRAATPPLFETMSVLGRARVRRRFRAALELVKQAQVAENKGKKG